MVFYLGCVKNENAYKRITTEALLTFSIIAEQMLDPQSIICDVHVGFGILMEDLQSP